MNEKLFKNSKEVVASHEANSLELLTTQVLQQMDSKLFELDLNGVQEIARSSKDASITPEALSKIQNKLEVQSTIADIHERSQELYKNTLSALKKIVIAGMTTLTLSGQAHAESGDIHTETTTNKASIEAAYGEKARDEMIERVKSPAYLERLLKETDGDIEEAKIIQQKRLKNLDNTDFEYYDSTDLLNEAAVTKYGEAEENTLSKLAAFTYVPVNPGKTIIGLPKEKIKMYETHELSHAATNLDEFIPEKTREQLSALLKEDTFKQAYKEYLSTPTEVLARKQTIDAKMERLHIKKYGERFTKDHFEKLLEEEYKEIGIKSQTELDEYIESNKALPEGIEFMVIYGEEHLEEIFNEIADTESPEGQEKIGTTIV